MNVLVIDNYDSFTYNLVHFLGDLGATLDVVRNDKIALDEIAEKRPEAIILSPGPVHAERGRRLPAARSALCRRNPDVRRLPWHAVHGPGLRRRGR